MSARNRMMTCNKVDEKEEEEEVKIERKEEEEGVEKGIGLRSKLRKRWMHGMNN